MLFHVSKYMHFFHYIYFIRAYLLPKRSTPVDQNLGSESTDSQLSVAIFKALRNLLVTQKSLMYFQTCQKGGNPCIPPPRVSKTRDISFVEIYTLQDIYLELKIYILQAIFLEKFNHIVIFWFSGDFSI